MVDYLYEVDVVELKRKVIFVEQDQVIKTLEISRLQEVKKVQGKNIIELKSTFSDLSDKQIDLSQKLEAKFGSDFLEKYEAIGPDMGISAKPTKEVHTYVSVDCGKKIVEEERDSKIPLSIAMQIREETVGDDLWRKERDTRQAANDFRDMKNVHSKARTHKDMMDRIISSSLSAGKIGGLETQVFGPSLGLTTEDFKKLISSAKKEKGPQK
ncbi:hypothetical protein QVD17_38123 [Tagetes erecta]|uniref:Uncharacterized protein n=1 Tax=Tagetes erecta TaxID=13708 RepID=A0AAD8NKM8_TARER|nr:hypothetical protein QVD17_38123 [Tagetes erecta]